MKTITAVFLLFTLAAQAQEWRYTYMVEVAPPKVVDGMLYEQGEEKWIVVDSYLFNIEDLTFRSTEGGVDEGFVIFPENPTDTIRPGGSGAYIYQGGLIPGTDGREMLGSQQAYDAFFSDAPLSKPVKPGLWDIDFRSYRVTVPLLFASGLWDGLNEVLHTHYPRFQARFPGANPAWWNPAVSWENKWKIDADGSVMTGFDRFPGSSTVFVFVTDGYHATRAADHLFLYAGIALNIGERKRWTHYLVDVGLHSLARSIGFNAVYHIAF